jgi:N-acetylmuramoyl-L-alanine amidase-like protein
MANEPPRLRFPLGSAEDLAPAAPEPDDAEQARLRRMASPEDIRRSEVTIAELVDADPRAAEAPVALRDFDPDAMDPYVDVSRETSTEYEDGSPRGAGNPAVANRMRSIARRVLARGGRVKESPGWATRGRSSSLNPSKVIDHHTAAPRDVDALLINGRADLAGPLCNFALHADGTVVLIAAGRANHAGVATVSSSASYGIEATGPTPTGSTGPGSFAYADYVRLVACICDEHGWQTGASLGHLEIATPAGRKVDAAFGASLAYADGKRGMAKFRTDVAAYRKGGGGTPTPPPIPQGDWLDMATPAEIEQAFLGALNDFYKQGIIKGQDTYADGARVFEDRLSSILAEQRKTNELLAKLAGP